MPVTGPTKKIRVKKQKPKMKRITVVKQKAKKSYNPTPAFERNMNKYNRRNKETIFFPMFNRQNGPASEGYLSFMPAVTLPTFGATGSVDVGISCVCIQTGNTRTQANQQAEDNIPGLVYTMGGYSTSQGVGSYQIQGNYCKLKSTLLRININVDPYTSSNQANNDLLAASLPRQFRLIQVKSKRENSVPVGAQSDVFGLNGSIGRNLFIDEINEEKGLSSKGSTADPFTWLINKQKWWVYKDERFTLYPNCQYTKSDAVNTGNGPNGTAKSQRFKNYYLPCPKDKVKFNFSEEEPVQQPLDWNYVVTTIILCKSMGGIGEFDSKGWNVQATGMTTALDE